MKDNTREFIHFAQWGTEADRATWVAHLQDRFSKGDCRVPESMTSALGVHANTLSLSLSNPALPELCKDDPSFGDALLDEILGHLMDVAREYRIVSNPFKEEEQARAAFHSLQPEKVQGGFQDVAPLIEKQYSPLQLDTAFYQVEIEKAMQAEKPAKRNRELAATRDHLSAKWQALLQAKELQRLQDFIDEQRKPFLQDLFDRMEKLRKLMRMVSPVTGKLGRLWDLSKGSWKQVNWTLLEQYSQLLEKEKSLQELADLLGRMREAEHEVELETYQGVELRPRWQISTAAKSELVGIRESRDLDALLPTEVSLLSHPELEPLFYAKYADAKLQTYEFVSQERILAEEQVERQRQNRKPIDKGPIIIAVDTSGSMHGLPEQIAKTLCFALLRTALRENRKCFLISFSTGIQTLDLTSLADSLGALVQFLSMSFHGGTNATPALMEALHQMESGTYRKADLLMVTDGITETPSALTLAGIDKARTEGNRFHALFIGTSANPAFAKAFDNCWQLRSGDSSELKQLITQIRNI